MNDVIVELVLAEPGFEETLAAAIETYAVWRETLACSLGTESEAPDIMVKTRLADDIIRKTLIFQDSIAAEKFMDIWRALSVGVG